MSTPCRFDDNDYKNWLKCSVALIHFKEGLHEYIDKEVNNLHADIHNTISAKLVGTSVQNQCYTCTWQDIKWNKGTWRINCQSQICDKWLSEILAKHTNPQNRNINWKNADITRWPADPYEVAKVYMPKGLDRTKNHPQDFDAPAVLSLLKYCVWFSQMIPNYNIVTDLIDFRNEVMHSGDLRITDFKKDNCIDIMTQLLTDLNIHGDVLTELQKIKREDIDINYRETEVRALRGLVHQLKDDHNTAIEEVKGNTMETRVTTETNFQVLEAKVEQLTEQYQNIKSFLANNLDIDDKDISDNIHVIEKEHQELETNIASVERRTDTYVAEIEDKKKTKQSPVLEGNYMYKTC
ncbi:hypothetical protein ACJMK2_008356 [Sinanodonta woodiana]|uniref:DZIP3-like HEPN domain-containing protein n=1 Tax=Sinanodonta woodiana TaxID=1069815 RepID=A0ABD3VPE5_SINWO